MIIFDSFKSLIESGYSSMSSYLQIYLKENILQWEVYTALQYHYRNFDESDTLHDCCRS